ncbi:MAG: amino acid permease [Crocinitomicaceae bacterium]|nr:amino acid permease [Crocinitomicaceae bacterium]
MSINNSELKKSFGLKMAVIIVMSAIIGSGVFKKVAPMAEMLHTPWLVVAAWLLAGIIVLFGVFCIAELGAMFPDSGGPFIWLEKVYGKLISFLYGWSCFTVIQTAAISSIAFVFAGALNTFTTLPRLPEHYESFTFLGLYPLDNIGAKIISCLLIIALTLVNIKGTKKGGNLSLIFTFLIVISLSSVIIGAFGSGAGSVSTFGILSKDYPKEGFTLFAFISAMVLAMRAAFWGYEGWLGLGFIGEEIKNPQKNLPRALFIGISIIILLYLLVNSAYLYVMPIDEMLTTIHQNENNIAAVLVMDKILGSGGAYVISAMILVSTFGCTNATILVSSRIYYAMAQKRLFFRKAARTHSQNQTPKYALIYQCVWACLLVFSGSFELLTDLVIIAAFIFNGLIVFGVIRLRKTMKETPRPYKTPLYPFVPVVFIFFCVVLSGISFYESPAKSLMGLLLIVSGLPFYFYWRKKLQHQ